MPFHFNALSPLHKRIARLSLVFGLLVLFVYLSSAALYADELETLYAKVPQVALCDPGKLADREKGEVLAYVNRIRRLHNLSPVVYAAAFDQETAQAGLLIAANQQMTHHPAESFACFSKVGAEGSATSNLAITLRGNVDTPPLLSPSTADVAGWLIDPDVPELGHRRWLLNPFLRRISYGRVDTMIEPDAAGTAAARNRLQGLGLTKIGAELENDNAPQQAPGINNGVIRTDFIPEFVHGAAMKVIYDENRRLPATTQPFVAYPYGEYPLDLFQIGWFWSFSVVADFNDYWGNANVDFANATVRVQSSQGNHRVYNVSHNNDAAGLPNLIQWQVDGIVVGQTYRVTIDNVLVKGAAQSYTYTVTLVEPDFASLDLPVHQIRTFTETLSIRSGETFALYVPPPYELPGSYAVSRPDIQMQMVDHSPYISFLRVTGTIGDEVRFRFASGAESNTVTLRITVNADGVDNPLDALRSELAMPVHLIEGKNEVVRTVVGARFAVYIPPAAAEDGIRRVQWSQPQGTQLDIEFHNERVLLITAVKGTPDAQATISLGDGKEFHVQVDR